jgi:hypothetical protein
MIKMNLSKHQQVDLVSALAAAVSAARCRKDAAEAVGALRSRAARLLRDAFTTNVTRRDFWARTSPSRVKYHLDDDMFSMSDVINEKLGFPRASAQGFGEVFLLRSRHLHVALAHWGSFCPHSPGWFAKAIIKTTPIEWRLESFRLVDTDHRVLAELRQ